MQAAFEVALLASLASCGRVGFDAFGTLEDGLVGHWPFEEGSGDRTADASGFSNDGMLVGGVRFVPGRIGFGLAFDGIDDAVLIDEQTNALDPGTRTFSYCAWVFVEASVGEYDAPWWRGGSSTFYPGYDFELGTGQWKVNISDGNVLVGAVLGPEILGRWVHLAAVVDRDARTLSAYLDGVLGEVKPIDLGSLSSTRTAVLGASASDTAHFRGVIDDVRVYGHALTPDEIGALYNVP